MDFINNNADLVVWSVIMEIEYIYTDEKGRTITRLKPQKTVEEYRAHSGGLWADDAITEITETMGEKENAKAIYNVG